MNCAKHTEVPASAFCRTCGKAMCPECTRDVRGVIYCEQCIADRLSGTMPAVAAAVPIDDDHLPKPGLAALLGFIPGVGAVYNGQYGKGFLHLIIFVTLIAITNEVGPIMIPVWFFFVLYQVIDAHKTARARRFGLPLPDPFGLNNVFGNTQQTTPPPASAAYAQSNPNPNAYQAGFTPDAGVAAQAAPAYVEPAPRAPRAPIGAIILLIMGFLFLLQNVGIFEFNWVGKLWPLILIALGIHMMWRRGFLKTRG
jgi:hypothetical protein